MPHPRNRQDEPATPASPGRRRAGLLLLLFGCIVYWLPGFHHGQFFWDFLPTYSGARCMVRGCDPYSTAALLQTDATAGVNPSWARQVMVADQDDSIYPPPTLFLLTPFGAMPWRGARFLWLILTGLGLAVAGYLVWTLCAGAAPVWAGLLVGMVTATSTIFMMGGNITGVALGLCVAGVCCLLREKHLALGAICLGLSLLLKPQLGGLIWLYLLLASPLSRRFALRALAAAALVALPGFVWISLLPAARHWPGELRAAIAAWAGPGGNGYPGLRNPASYGFLNLQALFSAVTPDPNMDSLASVAIAAPMLLVWLVAVLRSGSSRRAMYLGLAATAALTLLPVYHRHYDSRLLLLALPAAFLLWRERGARRWFALLPGFLLMVFTAHSLVVRAGALATATQTGPLWLRLAGRPYPAITLLVACVYLWLFAAEAFRGTRAQANPALNGTAGSPAGYSRRQKVAGLAK